jgi:hypothetical protein
VSDPIEILRALAPETDRSPVAPGVDPVADALLASVVAASAPVRSRRRSRWFTGGAVVVGVGLTAGAVAAVVSSREPVDVTVLSCWGAGDAAEVQVALVPDGRDPVEQCREQWTAGTLPAPAPDALTACTTGAGIISVVPGGEAACAARGWSVAIVPEPDGELARSAAMSQAVVDRLYQACAGPAEAVAIVEEVMASFELDWSIDADRLAEGDCAAPAFEGATRTVTLIPRPDTP